MQRDFMDNKKIVGIYATKEEALAQKLKWQAEGFHETYVLTEVGMFPEKYNVLQSTIPKEQQKPYENTPKLHIDIALVLFALLGALDGGGGEDDELEDDEGEDDEMGDDEGEVNEEEVNGQEEGNQYGDGGESSDYDEGVLEQFLWNYTLMEQLAPNEPTYVSLKHTPKFHEMVKVAHEKGSMCSCGMNLSNLLRGLGRALEKDGNHK